MVVNFEIKPIWAMANNKWDPGPHMLKKTKLAAECLWFLSSRISTEPFITVWNKAFMPIALDESSSGRAASAPIQLQKAQETRAIHLGNPLGFLTTTSKTAKVWRNVVTAIKATWEKLHVACFSRFSYTSKVQTFKMHLSPVCPLANLERRTDSFPVFTILQESGEPFAVF